MDINILIFLISFCVVSAAFCFVCVRIVSVLGYNTELIRSISDSNVELVKSIANTNAQELTKIVEAYMKPYVNVQNTNGETEQQSELELPRDKFGGTLGLDAEIQTGAFGVFRSASEGAGMVGQNEV
jgi:hypothetical protein